MAYAHTVANRAIIKVPTILSDIFIWIIGTRSIEGDKQGRWP